MASADDYRTAVLIDRCGGTLSHLMDDEMVRYITSLPSVDCCDQDENLSDPHRLEDLIRGLVEKKVDRLVIVGGSPKIYERSFGRLKVAQGVNPYMFRVANIREQGAWVTPDSTAAREKIKGIIAKTIREAQALHPIEEEKLKISKTAVIIGGGVVGIRAARALADANVRVTLLTEGDDIGGKAVQLTHFYDRPADVSSWFQREADGVKTHPRVEVKTSVAVKGISGSLGDYGVTVEDPAGKRRIVRGAAVILATGYEVVRNREGIFDHHRFISPAQMEAMLREGSGKSLADENNKPIETVVFVLDLVNETIKIDSANAVKNGIVLRETHGCTVCVLCRDVKVSLDGMEKQYRRAREMGIIFVKYDDPPRFSLVDSQVNIDVKEVSTRLRGEEYILSILSDVVVLSERFTPSKSNKMLAEALGIPLHPDGYLMDDNPQFVETRVNRRGLFIAGGCCFPRPLDEALVEAEAAASAVTGLLSSGEYRYDGAVAEIDPAKCAVCLTCPRVCPHSAIVVEKYGERNIYLTHGYEKDARWKAARVIPVQCYGCGICVSSCPTKAITLRHQTDREISLGIGASF